MKKVSKISKFINELPVHSVLTPKSIAELIFKDYPSENLKITSRKVINNDLNFSLLRPTILVDEHKREAKKLVLCQLIKNAQKKRKLILFGQRIFVNKENYFLALNDARGGRRWIRLDPLDNDVLGLEKALSALVKFEKKEIVLFFSGDIVKTLRNLIKEKSKQPIIELDEGSVRADVLIYSHSLSEILQTINKNNFNKISTKLTHLDKLEAESIFILREVMSEAQNPVMLYSVGKDSSVMLHLARKAFYPSPPPFPLLHIDTLWKFQAMYDFRDYMAKQSKMELLIYTNPDGLAKNINPFEHGSALHTDIMKTQSLKMALNHYKFDVAFGGARRDEEKSRAKERVFSFRTSTHNWDPKNQRPELWNLYNGKKNNNESIRVFPISNWTELDVWQYIYREKIPIVPLYFAANRPVVERKGKLLLMIDDDRFILQSGEKIKFKKIRFRTLGCYPLTGAIESEASDLAGIIIELLSSTNSERQGRAIDIDSNSSMEKKKQEGYF